MSIRVLIRDTPNRSIALATGTHALIFRHTPANQDQAFQRAPNASQTSLVSNGSAAPRCMAEFAALEAADLGEYRSLSSMNVHGTLGLITLHGDVFLCVVSGASKVATVRPGETVQRILSVEFHCLNRSDYDNLLNEEVNPYPTDTIDDEGFESGFSHGRREHAVEHPCLAIKKLLSSGTFYYSADFDVTRRLQDRSLEEAAIAIDSLDAGFLWNSYMIQPLVGFRSRLSHKEKQILDASRILTSAVRGYVATLNVPVSSSPVRTTRSGLPSTLTVISRLSCRRAGTRFNSRGIDDDGNVANYVETETVFWSPGMCFSYVQVRGSVPIFWEQATGLLPGQQKISITRSPEATQPAFDKHFEGLEQSYGAVHIVNLLSRDKAGELDISNRYRYHVSHCGLANNSEKGDRMGDHELLKVTNYDFHAETRGPGGYEAAEMIQPVIRDSIESFAYYFMEEIEEHPKSGSAKEEYVLTRPVTILQQEGVFRTNCLDCLDRTNLVQTIVSRLAFEIFLKHRSERANADFWMRHSSLWADNGDALSKIYAGTGALKSSFTRHGKMSLAGALADARKSATRMYINNFADKGRQNTIDMLLGRLVEQSPVHLYDPINDYINSELNRRAGEYTTSDVINLWVGTFNLNGRDRGLNEDLSSWLLPDVDPSQQFPEIVAVGFQEIVELSPQQIMSTDPARRRDWEEAVKVTLNENAQKNGVEEYVLLRGGQLVGASLSLYVRASKLQYVKNVDGSLKKTGMSGIAGNKGAVAIRFEYANTSLCFVTAHLAAGFANYQERNRDYKTISQGLRFQRNRSIDDHDNVVWLGDFNYRVGLSNEEARHYSKVGDLERLYENDQLNIQMVKGFAFPYYSEARITFPPTYRFDIGTDQYDTSEKARIPAWTDRILRKGNGLRQINYDSAPLRFSDHRPVYATFACEISIVDEKRREQLTNEIYTQRRKTLGKSTSNGDAGGTLLDKLSDEDGEDDLLEYESVEPGLPPASSDRRKWWFDNGQPARSTVKPPGSHMPNPLRPSNPFKPSPEPDWVQVQRSDALPETSPILQRTNSVQSSRRLPPSPPATRRLPPPRDDAASVLSSQPTIPTPASFDGASSRAPPIKSPPIRSLPPRGPSPTPSTTSTSSISRKPAPPIPKKNPSLKGTPESNPSPKFPNTQLHDKPTMSSESLPTPREAPSIPAPRRSMTVNSSSSMKILPPPKLKPTSPTSTAMTNPSQPSGPTVLRKMAPPPATLARKLSKSPQQKPQQRAALPVEEEEGPPLPPRRVDTGGAPSGKAGRSLMDEAEEDMEGLKDWQVLRPR